MHYKFRTFFEFYASYTNELALNDLECFVGGILTPFSLLERLFGSSKTIFEILFFGKSDSDKVEGW